MTQGFLTILILFSLVMSGLGTGFPDGLWNGKPWATEKILEGVEKEDPQALAEWAYCSRDGWGGIKVDEEQIFKHAERSAQTGNDLGAAILARCYLKGKGVAKDEKMGLEITMTAAEKGHPLALNNLANYHLLGRAGLKVDLEQSLIYRDQAIEGGCVLARENRFFLGYQKSGGVTMDQAEVIQEAVAVLQEGNGLMAASLILRLQNDQIKSPLLTAKVMALALKRIQAAVEMGHTKSMSTLGVYYTHHNRENEGIPLILRGAQKPDLYSSTIAFRYSIGTEDSKRAGSMAQNTTIYRLAREAFNEGSRLESVTRSFANSHLYWWEGIPIQPDTAEPAIQLLRKTKSRYNRLTIGRFYSTSKNNSFYDVKRGTTNNIYAAADYPSALELLSQNLLLGKPENIDRVRGYAALTRGLEKFPTKWLRESKEPVEKKMSPEQLAESAELIKRGYPHAEEFQREAIARLIELGDLPEGTTFENVND
ncbi:tetratricopeptide repeat protein [Verrucomicrobiaceae bacterium 227]